MAHQDKRDDGEINSVKITFANLITEALNNAPNGELVISDIYKSINLRHPQYKLEDIIGKKVLAVLFQVPKILSKEKK